MFVIIYDYGTEEDFFRNYYGSFPTKEDAEFMISELIKNDIKGESKYFNIRICKVIKDI
jgi:hypothetical protein